MIDPVILEISWTRIVSAVDEAAATFVRTSFSNLVREANDFAVVLTDARGRSIAQSSMSIPSFIGTLPATIKHFLAHFGADLAEGDVLIMNDPWMGSGHIHDATIATPIFRGGKLVAFAGVTTHLPDIGGRLRSTGIREIFEEGLQIPMCKLVSAGQVNDTVVAFIRQNVRVPDAVMGDIWGAVSACRKCQTRLTEILDETGIDVEGLSDEVISRSERAMRRAISELPDGDYSYEVVHDGFEDRIVIKAKVTVAGDEIAVDYEGTSGQLPRAVNVVPVYTFAYTAYGFKALLSPDIPNNEGSFLPITTRAPEGSILNPRYPAAGGARGMIGHLLPGAVMGALSQVLPDRIWAPGAGNAVITLSGYHRGERFSGIYLVNGGQGASAARGGLTGLSFPSNLANPPIEVIEGEVPITVLRRAIRTGSGGGGARQGGNGLEFSFVFRGDTPAIGSFVMTRYKVPPSGIHGGEPGERAALYLNGVEIDPTEPVQLVAGDEVSIFTAGGGGFGLPVALASSQTLKEEA